MDMTKIDLRDAQPLERAFERDRARGDRGAALLGAALLIVAAPCLILWALAKLVMMELRLVGRLARAVGQEVIAARGRG